MKHIASFVSEMNACARWNLRCWGNFPGNCARRAVIFPVRGIFAGMSPGSGIVRGIWGVWRSWLGGCFDRGQHAGLDFPNVPEAKIHCRVHQAPVRPDSILFAENFRCGGGIWYYPRK